MYCLAYDNSHEYKIDKSGELFWNIFNYATLKILYLYPRFFQWFQDRVITGLSIGDRVIFATYSAANQFTGYTILKTCPTEQKICTLQVLPQFRRSGYGRLLLTTALSVLRNKPVITVAASQLDLYSGLLSEYNFGLVDTLPNEYVDGETEYVFQGTLVVKCSKTSL